MRKYFVSFMLLLSLLILGFAEAQQLAKVYRVGVLSIAQSVTRLSTDSTALKGLRDGLKEAGYVEGKNLVLDIPLQKTYDELRSVAGRYKAQKVDVIVAVGGTGAASPRATLLYKAVRFTAEKFINKNHRTDRKILASIEPPARLANDDCLG